ncbi:MAG: DEAD/DEAH box helicase, partial [Planctomycetota bacterium]|nr:DEAD/DEAH box helicase [Planctomycetota bacterium]
MTDFATYFKERCGVPPHDWQKQLGEDPQCRNRLIRIPTGLGKTMGALNAWLYHRVQRQDDSWPRRLVWCLPMRVLVEQTEAEVRRILGDLAWDGNGSPQGKVGVYQLMGGVDTGDWYLYPEHPAVLVGTQDMLLSRALNRGYGSPRARWPIEFGLLNHDALWIMDEVQLMDVGLATSAQLQAYRDQDAKKGFRPCYTWWMSATLQP